MPHVTAAGRGPVRTGRRSATRFALGRRSLRQWITFAALAGLAALGGAGTGAAAELAVSVVDPAGHGVADVAVAATPLAAGSTRPAPVAPTAVMDQRKLAFVPRVLVVAVGTRVSFPNNDSVSHQVYSFSPAKKFQLPLYKGLTHPPLTFDQAGLVVVGCNIHDEMAGYIYVTDAPYFGKTDELGSLLLTGLAPGDYRIVLWSPLIADAPATLVRTLHVTGDLPVASRAQLTRNLRARPEPRPRRSDWEY